MITVAVATLTGSEGEEQATMPSAMTKGLPELRVALLTSVELRELQNRVAAVTAIGAKHSGRLARTLTTFLDSEDPSCFWYFPLLNNQLLADLLWVSLHRISAGDPDPGARTKANGLIEKLNRSDFIRARRVR